MTAAVRPLDPGDRRDRLLAVRVAQGLAAVIALLTAAGGAVALIAPPLGPSPLTSAGQAGSLAALMVLAAGASVVAAGSIAWFGRPDRSLAVIAFLVAATWFAGELAGSASVTREARSLGMAIAPMFVPLAVHLPMRALGTDGPASRARPLIAALYAAVAVAALGRALTYDPFFDVDCAPVCARGDNVVVVHQDIRLASSFELLGRVAALAGSLGLLLWAMSHLARRWSSLRHPERALLVAAAGLGGALAWWATALLTTAPALPAEPPLLWPSMAAAASLAAMGAAVFWLVGAAVRRAAALRRIGDAISAGAGAPSLRATLARTLGDERVTVVYPVEGGAFVDELGAAVEPPRAGGDRAVATVVRGDSVIALVEHRVDLDPDLLDREIGAAARLAVDNERLEATIRARLRELQASRARIVAAGDEVRGRSERDLHDGAQQRLLAVSFELRLALAALVKADVTGGARAGLEAAIEELDRALAELRELAHGIHPVVLAEDGLTGALASLAEEAPMPVVVEGEVERCAGPTELAAYLAVEEAMRRADGRGSDTLRVSVESSHGRLVVRIAGRGLDGGASWLRIEDRVGAAGGRLTVTGTAPEPVMVTVELPCA